MERIEFTKMHGLGNCYIYLDLMTNAYNLSSFNELAKEVSNQNTGIGSDGLILILPSSKADVKMRIFNKDGSEAKNCGNGLRCVAKYAFEHDLVSQKAFTIETLGGLVEAKVRTVETEVVSITIDMGVPHLERQDIPMLGNEQQRVIEEPLFENHQPITCVSMGNPHGLFFYDSIQEAPIHELGPLLADHHPTFPEGLNVGFIEMVNRQEMIYRVWERGSGITQACGTGACAAAVASILTQRAEKNTPIKVHLLGGDLEINWTNEGRVLMTGPATYICQGHYFLKDE